MIGARTPAAAARARLLCALALAVCCGWGCARAAQRPANGRAAGGAVTLHFWALGREGEVVQELMPEFERANPDLHVVVQQIPLNVAHEKLLTAYVGKATPDLAQVGNTWIPELAAVGALADLGGPDAMGGGPPASGPGSGARLGTGSGPDTGPGPGSDPGSDRFQGLAAGDFFPGIWDTNVIAGRVYGIPWYVDTRLLFYRSDLLAAAGFAAPPRTWSQWLEAMRRIKARAGRDHYAILMPTDEWHEPAIFALQRGATLLRDGGRYGAFAAPACRAAIELYAGLFREGLAQVVDNSQVPNAWQQFAAGDFAMWITGPWNVGELRRRLPPAMLDRWMTAPLPAPDPGGDAPGISVAGGSSLAVFRASRHQKAAWRLVAYLAQPRQQLRFYALTGDLPARREAWRDPALAGEARTRAFWEQLHHVVPTPKVPEWEEIANALVARLDTVLRGGVPVGQALNALDRDVDFLLAKRRWVLERARHDRFGRLDWTGLVPAGSNWSWRPLAWQGPA